MSDDRNFDEGWVKELSADGRNEMSAEQWKELAYEIALALYPPTKYCTDNAVRCNAEATILEIIAVHAPFLSAETARADQCPICDILRNEVLQYSEEVKRETARADRAEKIAELHLQEVKNLQAIVTSGDEENERMEASLAELRQQLPHFLAGQVWDEWHGPLAKIPATHAETVASLKAMIGRFEAVSSPATQSSEVAELRQQNEKMRTALEGLSKGNRSPGVLAIAREALAVSSPACPTCKYTKGPIRPYCADKFHEESSPATTTKGQNG